MPHIRLPRLGDEPRVVQGRGAPITPRDQAAHGLALLRQLDNARTQLERGIANRQQNLPAVPAGIQLLIQGATTQSGKILLEGAKLKGLRLEVIEERRDGLFLAVSLDPEAGRFAQTIESFLEDRRTPTGRRQRGVRQVFEIDEIEVSGPPSKKGDELAIVEIRADELYVVDIEVAAGREQPTSEERRQAFTRYLADAQGILIGNGVIVEEDYALFRARLSGTVLNDLLNFHPWVISVDLLPVLERQGYDLYNIRRDALPPLDPPPEDAPVVTVLDGGIIPEHPLLQTSLHGLQHESFLPNNPSVIDEGTEGHGTAIVSLVAFSSLRRALLNGDRITPVRTVVARVLDGNTQIPENLNLKEVIPRAAQRMRDIHGARIANHSLASRAPFNRNRMSVWGETLDRLAYDDGGPGFLIVTATGNIDGRVSPTIAQIEEWLSNPGYPRFLLNERCRLRNPAQAINVLTVGAYVPEAGTAFHLRAALGHQCIGQSNQPSPFTRSGFGYLNEVKPEVVEEGGNWYRDDGGRLIRPSQITDVAVANSQFALTGHLVKFETGTSLSAPRIAHLAARLLEILPAAGVDLLRTLIVNSAAWPARAGSISDTLRLFGYGVPNRERAMEPGGPRALMFVEDSIRIGHVQFFRIPFPSEMFDASPETVIRVSVTLAYRAPVRKSTRRYRGTVLEWKFGKRGEDLPHFRQRCSAISPLETDEGEDDVDEGPIGNWNWVLGSRIKNRGTVQKDWFEAPAQEFGDELFLAVIGRRGWLSKRQQDEGFHQDYAVSVCIEAVGVAIPIHERIEALVRVAVVV